MDYDPLDRDADPRAVSLRCPARSARCLFPARRESRDDSLFAGDRHRRWGA